MKREEEIVNASIVYSEYEYDQTVFENGFLAGARWADENPKSLWISVKDDLPCNHKELISPNDKRDTTYVLVIIHGHVVLSRMYKLDGKWHWENDEPTHWMPLPELPKE